MDIKISSWTGVTPKEVMEVANVTEYLDPIAHKLLLAITLKWKGHILHKKQLIVWVEEKTTVFEGSLYVHAFDSANRPQVSICTGDDPRCGFMMATRLITKEINRGNIVLVA